MPINWKVAAGAVGSIVACVLYLLRSYRKQGEAIGQADQKLKDATEKIAGMYNQGVADDLSKRAQ